MLLLLLLHICETLAVLEQDLSIRVCLSVCYLVHSASCSLCSYLLFHTREFHLFMSLNKILLLDLSHSPYILLCCLDTFYTVATENNFVLKWDTGTSLRCWLHFFVRLYPEVQLRDNMILSSQVGKPSLYCLLYCPRQLIFSSGI